MQHDRGGLVALPDTIGGISALAERFDGFVLDQWGVLHNGVQAYPGSVDCLRRLRDAGKRIVILSNSGRRSEANREQLARLGFAPELYTMMITAGEDARQALERRQDPFYATLGRRCFVVSRDGEQSMLDGLGLDCVTEIDSADFIFVISIDSPRRLLADYQDMLARGVARGLPMVCANPDFTRVTSAGTTQAPGVLALRYEELGGRVRWHGKPHRPIYESCLRALGLPSARVVAVGDSVDHDVVGAATVGLAGALVAGGIHAAAFGIAWGETPGAEAQQRFFAGAPAVPRFIVPVFAWQAQAAFAPASSGG